MADTSSSFNDPANALYAYLDAFVDELARSGLRHVVICPGSRSTPLALTFALREGSHGGTRIWMHVDERSAAFFGLGLAKRLGEPVALVCTSGTAAANFFPAVVEAHLSRVSLLLLTADRPPELRDCGAPQAIDQTRLYGTYTKWFVDVAMPDASDEALRYIRTLASRAIATTLGVPAGPIHLNFPFREPLAPTQGMLPHVLARGNVTWSGRAVGVPGRQPYVRALPSTAGDATLDEVQRIAGELAHARRGLLIAGPGCSPELAEPLVRLAHQLRFPLLADPLSGLRGNPDALSAYDAFFRVERFVKDAEPDMLLRFGAMPTSKALLQYLQRFPQCQQIVVDEAGQWAEPTQLASEVVQVHAARFAQALSDALPSASESDARWLRLWLSAEAATRKAVATTMRDFAAPFEGRVFSELADVLPDGAALVVGNSMPVRDCDTFFWPNGKRIRVLGNRGASGIDGVVSTALGIAAAQPDAPTVLVIGDLSFYHDLNGLLAAKLHGLNLTVALINNDGGGIFSFLPQADLPDHFERLFGTPTGLDFAPVVRMYGGRFVRSEGWEQFRSEVMRGWSDGGLRVLEIRTERASNVAMHRELWGAVQKAVAKVLADAENVVEAPQ